MEGKAEVFGPEENGRFAKYTLWNINLYLSLFGARTLFTGIMVFGIHILSVKIFRFLQILMSILEI